MKEREYILALYEIYNCLLTQREKSYFENYYYEDYSLQEIADNFEVSKSYVGKYLNNISKKLNNYENKLNLYVKNEKIKEIVKSLDEKTRNEILQLL